MEKSKLSGANQLEIRNLESVSEERDNELRTLTDPELVLAGGGDDVPLW
jgi:hypothetical protein